MFDIVYTQQFAAHEIAYTLGLNPDFLLKQSKNKNVNLSEKLKELDRILDYDSKINFGLELVQLLSN